MPDNPTPDTPQTPELTPGAEVVAVGVRRDGSLVHREIAKPLILMIDEAAIYFGGTSAPGKTSTARLYEQIRKLNTPRMWIVDGKGES